MKRGEGRVEVMFDWLARGMIRTPSKHRMNQHISRYIIIRCILDNIHYPDTPRESAIILARVCNNMQDLCRASISNTACYIYSM